MATPTFVPQRDIGMSWWCAQSLTRMAAKPSSKSKTSKGQVAPSGKGFTVTTEPEKETKERSKVSKRAKRQKPKVPKQTTGPESGQTEPVEVEVVRPTESKEDREFRERYLSADKELQPDWKQQMDAAKTKEERFKVGLKVGDFKTSYGILIEEVLGSLVDGDKERLDSFLTDVGIASWQLALIQMIVIGVPFAGVTYVMGLWKWPA